VTAALLGERGAVVTGGGRGIGAAVARALSAAGARVVVAARTAREIEEIASELRGRGSAAWAVPCDVTDEASVIHLGREARRLLGMVDILVNNAGDSASAPLRRITLADWERMLDVNATGTFLCTREFAPEMAGRGWGRIVNVASIAGLEGAKYVAHYSAAKHAVLGFTRSVALEFAGTGVTVNAVCPGYVDTPMTERTLANVEALAHLSREEALTAVLASGGQDRLVSVEEVAAAVVDLCLGGSESSGQAIVLKSAGAGSGEARIP
jgi:NAD(P)-dependent dehydrogenase (short-subunit alcohol dehydrogenase family)